MNKCSGSVSLTMFRLGILLSFVCLLRSCLGAGVVCRDNDGNAVDWYV